MKPARASGLNKIFKRPKTYSPRNKSSLYVLGSITKEQRHFEELEPKIRFGYSKKGPNY